MTNILYDIVIIGGGPGGVAAGVYAARKQMKAVIITDRFGGQSMVSTSVENWIGDVSLKGTELAEKLDQHVRAQENLEIVQPGKVVSIERQEENIFIVTLESGDTYRTKNILMVTGGRHRHLGVPGEEEFKGRGVVYCSTCDAPMFRDKDAVVIGTGNSGLEAVEDLLPYAKKIMLMDIADSVTGDAVTLERIMQSGKVELMLGTRTTEIHGEVMVTGITYAHEKTGEEHRLDVQGVFVEIGVVPNIELVKDMVDVTEYGHIIVNPLNGATSVPGIYAAGDVTDQPYRQNNIAAGDAIKATLAIYDRVKTNA
jgi:alkyl hydroperoxide reductase subunit F